MKRNFHIYLFALACPIYLFTSDMLASPVQSPSPHLNTMDRDSGLVSYPVISGIGVNLSITSAGPVIFSVVPNSAASHSGKLHKGDVIISVLEGHHITSLKGKSMGEVTNLVRGPVGSSIAMRIRPANHGADFSLTLVRASVPVPGVTYNGWSGKAAPNVQFTKFGQTTTVNLADYRGKIVVLDLWASWCSTCYSAVDEMQQIARAHPEWKGRVELLTATIDANPSDAARAIKARNWNATTFLSLKVDDMKAMGIEVVPTMLIISPDGKIVDIGDPHAIPIESQIQRLLSHA
jgi:thiol-disulfide isomerase/thioredoxin